MGKYADALLTPAADPAPQQASRSYSDQLLSSAPVPQPAQQQSQGWGEWISESIKGKQDPRHAETPVFDAAQEFGADYLNGGRQIDAAPFLNAGDEQLAEVIKQNLGPRFIAAEKDANGYPVVRYRGEDGSERKAYVNKPGLDMQDVGRGIKGALPFLAGGAAAGAVTKGAPLLLGQVPAQMAAGAATSVAADLGLQGMGSEQGVDPVKAGITGALAGVGQAAAPMVGAAWRKLVTEPGLFDSATGRLTARGIEAARRAGLDPADMDANAVTQFAQEFARSGNRASAAGTQAREFGVDKTLGESSGRADQLLREQRARGGNYGETPAMRMKSFDDNQRIQVANALVGDQPVPSPRGPIDTIPRRLAPERSAQEFNPAELGGNIRGSFQAAKTVAKDAEREAWEKVGTITATDEALATLPDTINAGLGGFRLTDRVTPVAAQMAREIEDFIGGKAPEQVAGFLRNSPTRDVDQMRRVLGGYIDGLAPSADKTAAGKIYNAYNDWIRASAEKLATTDPNGAANLVIARGISREAKDAIAGERGTAGARILADVMTKADTPEGVVRALFSDKPGANKNGVADALGSLKTAYDKYLPKDQAKKAWDDVRLAYWLRIAQGKDGKPVGVQQFKTNLGRVRKEEATVFNMLLSQQERNAIRRLEISLTGIEGKNLNRSWTGPSVGGMFQESIQALMRAIGFDTMLGKGVAHLVGKPLLYAKGQAEVGRALATRAPSKVPRLIGPASSAAAAGSSRE